MGGKDLSKLLLLVSLLISLLLVVYIFRREAPPLPPYWRDYWDRQGLDVNYGSGFLRPFTKWDSLWFLTIARIGYFRPEAQAYAPLFPLMIRVVDVVIRDTVASGFLISLAFLLAALVIFWHLVRLEPELKNPWPTLFVFLGFPFSFFLFLPYSESVFLFFSLAAFYLYRRERFLGAISFGLLASLTRYTGVLVLLAFLCDGILKKIRRREERQTRLSLLLTLLALLFFFGVLWRIGNLSFETQEAIVRLWKMSFSPFFYSLIFLLQKTFERFFLFSLELILVSTLAFFLVIKSWRRLPLTYAFYVFGNLFLIFSKGDRGLPFSFSLGRYLLSVFPLFILAGIFFSRRPRLLVPYLLLSTFFLIFNWAFFLINYFVG